MLPMWPRTGDYPGEFRPVPVDLHQLCWRVPTKYWQIVAALICWLSRHCWVGNLLLRDREMRSYQRTTMVTVQGNGCSHRPLPFLLSRTCSNLILIIHFSPFNALQNRHLTFVARPKVAQFIVAVLPSSSQWMAIKSAYVRSRLRVWQLSICVRSAAPMRRRSCSIVLECQRCLWWYLTYQKQRRCR